MSIRQTNEQELRYMKHQNLEHEARVVGNYYRDIIRSYGTDVMYQKLDTTVFENYKGTIDQNMILQRAYGHEVSPSYECSADMISYLEVEQDIFQLNKYGLNPNADVTFYFDSTDFACALATKLGQYEEHPIKEMEFDCEVPDCTDRVISAIDPKTGQYMMSSYVSSYMFPYQLGLGYAEKYECDMLSGKLSVEIPGYEYGKMYMQVCDPYEHTDFKVEFPANSDLYRSLTYKYQNDEYLQTLIYLDYHVDKVPYGKNKDGSFKFKSILHGKIHGGVLFYSLNKLGKYLDKIHPEVGDLITIGFPDSQNGEKYEITDCFDKQLQSDGINPLLHKYVWKCKARRYVNNYDDVEMNEADKRRQEKIDLETEIDEAVAKKVSTYDELQDAAYGGYDGIEVLHKKHIDEVADSRTYVHLDQNEAMDICIFGCGSKMVTDGFDLFFVTSDDNVVKVTMSDRPHIINGAYFESGLKFLKASAESLVFTNFQGESFKIAEDEEATQYELELCLESLYDKQIDKEDINTKKAPNFYIFKYCKTAIWATEQNLYCKLASNGKLYKIA